MDIEDFMQKKAKLESDLKRLIHDRLKQFESETGYYPRSFNVDIFQLKRIGDPKSIHEVYDVSTRFNFED